MKITWKKLIAVLVIAAGATGVARNSWTRGQVVGVFKQLSHAGASTTEEHGDKSWIEDASGKSKGTWDRLLTLKDRQIESLGVKVVAAKQQTEPSELKLFGTTDYDPATVTAVRTQFDSRVDKVLVDRGSTVKKGDPLLELFSTDLAEAKSNYEAAISQWTRDKKVLDFKAPLASENILARKELIEVENDEAQSRLKMKLAKDKLLVYGLTDKEIENARNEDGVQKARMILRSRAAGVVVFRDVVQGNNYNSEKLLMTIAALDHLWVRGSVSELDADQVEIGEKLTIIFPFSNRTIEGTVGYIDKAIDADSRSARFTATIRNPDGRLKAGMFVRMVLKIPPKKGRVMIPRVAMVAVDRFEYVFVKKPGKPNRFERRKIVIVKENNDVVIVAEPSLTHLGVSPGEEVVVSGSLLLDQMYEDTVMTEGALLAERSSAGAHLPDARHASPVVVAMPR